MPKQKRTAKPPKAHKNAKKPHSAAAKQHNQEPEVLGADAPATVPGEHQAGGIDRIVSYLEAHDELKPIGLVISDVFGGAWTPSRELDALKALKADGRFLIQRRENVNVIGLRPSAEPGQTTLDQVTGENAAAAASTAEPPAKTIAEHLQDAQGRPLRIPWTHDVGSHVLLLTDGYEPTKVVIKNIKHVGNAELYDVVAANGGQTNEVPAYRIGRDLEMEGELQSLRDRLAMEERHRKRSKELADLYAAQELTEKELAQGLKQHREEMAETAAKLALHARTDPGQKMIWDKDGDEASTDNPTPRQERKDAPPAPEEDKFAGGDPVRSDVYEDLDVLGLDLGDVEASRLDQVFSSTGKPQRVQPVQPSYDGETMGDHVLVDVQDGVAVLLPVLTKQEWKDGMAATYGQPAKLPSDERLAPLAAGGKWCGLPVKVGRATCWLGSTDRAVLVRISDSADAEKPTGKEAAAGA